MEINDINFGKLTDDEKKKAAHDLIKKYKNTSKDIVYDLKSQFPFELKEKIIIMLECKIFDMSLSAIEGGIMARALEYDNELKKEINGEE
jgi:hypothetical protein